MAENILKLRVDSQEYDNKIKRAAEGLQRYADGCRKAGGSLEYLDDGVEQFVRELGKMDTVSKSAKGSINEMTKAFTDLSVQYSKLTDEEKNAPFGQALKSSLDELRGRIQSGNEEIKNISESLNGGGGLKDALDKVAGKFGLNIDMVTKFGSVVGVATTALKVAKDAFLQSESNIDEWGRTVKGAEGAYDIFLQTLNNGNWSNFFSNLSQAITGARDLYDAFDRLGSIKANNVVAIATTQAEIQQLRLLKQQGQDVDDKLKDATKRLAALQAQSANAGINAGKSQVVNTLRNGVNSIGGAPINDATLKYAADQIAKGGQALFDTMKRRAEALEKQGMVTRTQTISDSQGGTYERQYKVFDINALSREQQKQYAIAKTITERETEIQKGLSVWGQSVNEQAASAREQFKDNRYALQGSSGGSGGGSTTDPTSKIQGAWDKAYTKSVQGADKLKPADYIEQPSVWAQYADGIKKSMGGIKDEMTNLTEFTPNFNPYKDNIDKMNKSLKQQQMAFNLAGQAASNFGAALASIDDPSAKAAGEVVQAIASIALGFAMASSSANTAGTGWGWLAWLGAGMAAMATTISTIHSLTGYAQGGIVQGNSYSGDNLRGSDFGINAGELILNKAQQSTLASQLQGGGLQNLKLEGIITGETIHIVHNRYLKRSGQGEIVTW